MCSNSNNRIRNPVADSLTLDAASTKCIEPHLICADSRRNTMGEIAAALRTINDCPLLALRRTALYRLAHKLFGLFF